MVPIASQHSALQVHCRMTHSDELIRAGAGAKAMRFHEAVENHGDAECEDFEGSGWRSAGEGESPRTADLDHSDASTLPTIGLLQRMEPTTSNQRVTFDQEQKSRGCQLGGLREEIDRVLALPPVQAR